MKFLIYLILSNICGFITGFFMARLKYKISKQDEINLRMSKLQDHFD